jgi:hypothetical protein
VTVVVGRDATPTLVAGVENLLEEHVDVQVNVLDGGQEVWALVIGIE